MYTQRKYPRFPVTGSAILKVSDNKVAFPGMIETFSQGGVGICTDVNIEKGTPITLEINMSTGTENPKKCLTGVVRNFSNWGEKGLLGVQFDREINPDHEPQLYHYLDLLKREFITEYHSFSK